MIDISNMNVRFKGIAVYKNDITVKIGQGEQVGIIGKSGGGKSVFLRSLMGLVESDGQIVNSHASSMSMMFQDHLILPWLTIRQNILITGSSNSAQLESMAESFGIIDHIDKLPAKTSGGIRQRAALLRCLITNPSLILLDEPLNAVDEITASSIRKMISESCINKTMIIVSHNLTEILQMSNRILVIDKFGLKYDVNRHDIYDADHLLELIER